VTKKPLMFNFLQKLDYKDILRNNTNPLDLLDRLNIGDVTNNHVSPKVLILTKRMDIESDLIGIQLLKNGVEYIKINEEDVPLDFGAEFRIGRKNGVLLKLRNKEIITENIKVVLFRYFDLKFLKYLTGIHQLYIEQQWYQLFNCLQTSLRCLWINDPKSTFTAENRLYQLLVAQKTGFRIPDTSITNISSAGTRFCNEHPKKTIAKVLHHHEIIHNEFSHRFPTSTITANSLSKTNGIKYAPVILQERIAGREEIRITVVKSKVFPIRITAIKSKNKYSDLHKIEERFLNFEHFNIEKNIEKLCIKLNKEMGLLLSSIDLMVDNKGQIYFLEINPIGDWNWLEKHVDLPITDSVSQLILNSSQG
jgi:hypothetical protein